MLYTRHILTAALCALMMLFAAAPSAAKSDKGKNREKAALEELEKKRAEAANFGSVRYSGKSFRNKRMKLKFEPHVELVEGKITGIDRKGIYMDGEHFNVEGSKIVTPEGRELNRKALFVGLKVRLKLSYGTVEKTTVYGLMKKPRRTKGLMRSGTTQRGSMGDQSEGGISKEELLKMLDPPDHIRNMGK